MDYGVKCVHRKEMLLRKRKGSYCHVGCRTLAEQSLDLEHQVTKRKQALVKVKWSLRVESTVTVSA